MTRTAEFRIGQNLLVDQTGEPVGHPQAKEMFGELWDGIYAAGERKAH